MNNEQLTAVMSDPSAFRAALFIDADGGPRKLAELLDPWQRDDFAALDPGWRRVVGQTVDDAKQRAYLERPRGHSKTNDLAVMVSWALFASRRQISGVAAAGDSDQAKLLRDAIAKLVSLNDWLGRALDVQRYAVLNRHTGSELTILSADEMTSYGLTPDFVVADEVTHWKSDGLWVSLFSAAAKRSHCLLCVISNAGFGEGDSWQWRIREAARTDADWYFSRLDGPVASWISAKHLDEQRRLLPDLAYRRLWLNQWTSGSGDALVESDISAAVTSRALSPESEPGMVYLAGLDIGLSRDASACVVLSKQVGGEWLEERPNDRPEYDRARAAMRELGMIPARPVEEVIHRVEGTGKLRVVALKVWRPSGGQRVSLAAVEDWIRAQHERYGLSALYYDPHQAERSAESLIDEGIDCRRVAFSGAALQSMATTLLGAFNAGTIEIPNNADLLHDLRSLRVEERSYGVRLVSPRGPRGHGDLATALALAVHGAAEWTDAVGDYYLPADQPLVYEWRQLSEFPDE